MRSILIIWFLFGINALLAQSDSYVSLALRGGSLHPVGRWASKDTASLVNGFTNMGGFGGVEVRLGSRFFEYSFLIDVGRQPVATAPLEEMYRRQLGQPQLKYSATMQRTTRYGLGLKFGYSDPDIRWSLFATGQLGALVLGVHRESLQAPYWSRGVYYRPVSNGVALMAGAGVEASYFFTKWLGISAYAEIYTCTASSRSRLESTFDRSTMEMTFFGARDSKRVRNAVFGLALVFRAM